MLELMMNKTLLPILIALSLVCQLIFINNASAQNLAKLVEQGKLKVSLQVNQKKTQIVGQAIIIAIEVSTDRWFAQGSKVQHFPLKNVVMQADNIITINGSKRINGQSWATQTHEITMYPTKSGHYYLAPIKVDISVNSESDGVVSGTLKTLESNFNIELPKELDGIDNFIVSPKVSLSIKGHFDEEKVYAVGEAITQTVTIRASDTPAMMIPPINLAENKQSINDKSASAGVAGLSIYHKPAKVFDKSNRGALTGTREESLTYIFEKPGSYVIDEKVIYWWNITSNSLERLVIPSSAWSVTGGGFSQVKQKNNFTGLVSNMESVFTLIIILSLITLSYLGFIRRHQLVALYNTITKRHKRILRNHFLKAITEKNYLAATQYLYQYRLMLNRQTEHIDCPLAAKLNKLAFSNEDDVINQAITFSINDAKRLISNIDTYPLKKGKVVNFSPSERIKLNND